MKNKFKRTLQAAVLLSCTTLFPWQAMAEDDLGEYIYNFTYDSDTYFDAIVLTPGQELVLQENLKRTRKNHFKSRR